LSFFYEIRSPDNSILKRDGSFPDREAATVAAREDARKMKNAQRSERLDVDRIMVRQNADQATR